MSKFSLIIILILVASNNVYAKKKLYKWVDENGQVTYSDQVPPEQIKKKHEELSSSGIVVEKVGNIKTPEEIQADIKKRQMEADDLKLQKKREIQRINIIKSYANEEEILRLKEERISALERNIELAGQSLEFQKISREQVLSRAADNERDGVEISKALKSRIKTIEEKIKYQIQFIKVKKAEINDVRLKFENDLKIYRLATEGKL